MAAVFLISVLSLSSAQAGSLAGSEAQKLAHAVWNAMGVTICEKGSCAFQADNIKCVDIGSGKYGCLLEARRLSRNAKGEAVSATDKLEIKGWRARKLMKAFTRNGVELECRDDGCFVEIATVGCWKEFTTPANYSCDWQAAAEASVSQTLTIEVESVVPADGASCIDEVCTAPVDASLIELE